MDLQSFFYATAIVFMLVVLVSTITIVLGAFILIKKARATGLKLGALSAAVSAAPLRRAALASTLLPIASMMFKTWLNRRSKR